MEKNIFEGAKFGDKFLTRGGNITLFICPCSIDTDDGIKNLYEFIDSDRVLIDVDETGIIDFETHIEQEEDIVSRYKEPIDEDKLNELAYESATDALKAYWYSSDAESYVEGFEVGYRKAKEE